MQFQKSDNNLFIKNCALSYFDTHEKTLQIMVVYFFATLSNHWQITNLIYIPNQDTLSFLTS